MFWLDTDAAHLGHRRRWLRVKRMSQQKWPPTNLSAASVLVGKASLRATVPTGSPCHPFELERDARLKARSVLTKKEKASGAFATSGVASRMARVWCAIALPFVTRANDV
jgi:hypothetical protein